MNTVLLTVAECIKDFLNKRDDVIKLLFKGTSDDDVEPWVTTTRTNAYLRFIKNNFPEYDVVKKNNYVEIIIKEELDNQMMGVKNLITTISDASEISDDDFTMSYENDMVWSIDADGVNTKVGEFNISILNDQGTYWLNITPNNYMEYEEIDESFSSVNDLISNIKNYFS